MLDITKKFELGNTIYFECVYRNVNGFPTDPDNPSWEIKNAKGISVASGVPLKRTDGIWYIFWTPDNVGDYVLIFSGTIEDNSVIIRRKLKVTETRIK